MAIKKQCSLPEIGYIRLPTLLSVLPISRSSLYAGIKAGKYPAPIKLAERTSVWDVQIVRSYLDSIGK